MEMQKWIKFLFLPLRSSHSSKGDFIKQKQYSTISDTIEVGCNYSDDTKEEVRGSSLDGTRTVSQRCCFMLGLQGYTEIFQVGKDG